MSASSRINYVYVFCNNLNAVRDFYSQLIGLSEKMFYCDHGVGCLSYDCGGIEFMFLLESDSTLAVPDDFSAQPGGGGGNAIRSSWTISVNEDAFPQVVNNVKNVGYPCNQAQPVWLQDSYWAFVVLDPCGNTVELCMYPQKEPAMKKWVEPVRDNILKRSTGDGA